ncbi:MAG: NAD-dependent epimerase/dehydratase family protein [Hyphomonas sp.]
MKYLVTGGAGFIGSHLVDRILAEGHDVVVLDNYASGKKSNLAAALATGRLNLIEGSILSEADLETAMRGVDVVFHLAVECVRKSIGDPVSNHHINATGTLMTLEAARRAKVSRFVYCSSSEVYGNADAGALSEDETVCQPTTVYGASKLVGELYTQAYLHTYNMNTCIVRPFNAFGPREHDQGMLAEVIPRFVIKVMNGQSPTVFGDGSQGRDFTYVTDTADGLWRAAHSDRMAGEIVNLGWGRMVSVKEVAMEIIRQCGRNDIALEHVPERPGDIQSLIARTEKAEYLIGFRPTVTFSDGVSRYVDWFRSVYPDPSLLLEKDYRNWTLPS